MLNLLKNYNQYKKIIIGNNLSLNNFSNLKIIEHKKLLFLLSKSRYTFFLLKTIYQCFYWRPCLEM